MSAKSKNVNDLLAAIQRKGPSDPQPEPMAESASSTVQTNKDKNESARKSAHRSPKRRIGQPVQFWLHEEDRRLVRELAAWLAAQGLRPTDSIVVRSALRVVKTGNEFLKAYRDAADLDGRLKRHKTS